MHPKRLPITSFRLTRRQLLRYTLTSAAGLILPACNVQEGELREPVPLTPSPVRALESPIPVTGERVSTPAPGDLTLEQFLDLSSLLTGFDNLNPQLGQVYLEIHRSDSGLVELYEAAALDSGAPPGSLEEVEGLFADPQRRDLADRIIENWYSGHYQAGENQTEVVTFVDALAWKSVGYTKAQSLCGPHMGYWARPPQPPVESAS